MSPSRSLMPTMCVSLQWASRATSCSWPSRHFTLSLSAMGRFLRFVLLPDSSAGRTPVFIPTTPTAQPPEGQPLGADGQLAVNHETMPVTAGAEPQSFGGRQMRPIELARVLRYFSGQH